MATHEEGCAGIMSGAGAARDLLADPVDAMAGASVAGSFSRLGYVLIHNAGAVHPRYQQTAGGPERTVAGQVVAPPVYRFPGARPARADADRSLWDWVAAMAGQDEAR